jgi:hypothetical protein
VTPAFRWTLLWIAGSMVMVAGALGMVTASLIDHQYLPASADPYYHARSSWRNGFPNGASEPWSRAPCCSASRSTRL